MNKKDAVAMDSVTMVPPLVGSLWVRTWDKRYYLKITTIENNRVFYDVYEQQTRCRITSTFNSIPHFYNNKIPLSLDEV